MAIVPRLISIGNLPRNEPDQHNKRGDEYYRADCSRDDYLHRRDAGKIVLVIGAPSHPEKRPEHDFEYAQRRRLRHRLFVTPINRLFHFSA
jgi:hypothetical protein